MHRSIVLVAALGLSSMGVDAVCDEYCSDITSGYCKISPLYDTTVQFTSSTGQSYSKCASPSTNTPIYCPPPITAACESCGVSWSSGDNFGFEFSSMEACCPGYLDADNKHYGYDYQWNIVKAKRDSYPNEKGTCYLWSKEEGYSCRNRNWWGKGVSMVDSEARFLDEECGNSDHCNMVTKGQVNMVCSKISTSSSKKCLLKEDAAQEHANAGGGRVECSCSVFDHKTVSGLFTGLLWCKNNQECGGNTCARTTQDMKMYCDVDGAFAADCDNCRANDNACAIDHA